MSPERIQFGTWPDRRVDLGLPAEPLDIGLLVQREVMNAGLHRRIEALRAISCHQLIASADRAMYDMDRTAGAGAELIDLGDRERFGDRRPRQAMRRIVGEVCGLDLSRESAHHFVVLVMDARGESSPADGAKGGEKDLRRNARKALWMSTEGREFEGRRPRIDQFIDPHSAFFWIDCGIKREIHPRLSPGALRLGAKAFSGGDQAIVVIGHVDDRRHAAGRGAAGRPDKILLPLLTAAMDLSVDRAGKHKKARAPMAFAGRRGSPAHAVNDAFGDENIAILNDPIGEDDGSNKDFVRHDSNSRPIDFCTRWPQTRGAGRIGPRRLAETDYREKRSRLDICKVRSSPFRQPAAWRTALSPTATVA